MLYETFYEPFVLLTPERTTDNEGGTYTSWSVSKAFSGALITNSSNKAREANKEGVNVAYTLTTPRGLGLKFHDVIRREADGEIFRVVSNSSDLHTPEASTFQFEQLQVEGWVLTNE